MQLEISLEGTPVVLLGEADASRQAVLRYRRAGATLAHFDSPAAFMAAVALPARPGLVAVVGSPQSPGKAAHDGEWAPVLDHYRSAGVPVVREPAAGPRGHVTLVGGGPGSRGLLTVDAVEALRDADVVLFDRLAPWRELEQLTTAQLVDVGKLPGHHKVPQDKINALLVEYAKGGQGGGGGKGGGGGLNNGANVVRLKGGDPFVFGRGGEEALACAEAGIPVRIVSGISSSISVPAAAGIPVTHREVSHCFTVISGHAPLSAAEHEHLAGLGAAGGTLVVLMGVANLPHLASGLRRAGLPLETPLAVVERGYQAGQRTTVTELGRAEADTATCGNPAVIVIGDVVRLAGLASGAAGRSELRDLAASLLDA
ncbi:uroporphyrinogen-III C-methyltransferase [Sinomonas sp. JGH33]|uniref:uroporphyrinogen-III C-methyltransferase n=1 Tax=Sinomonas terricola TaxID=3110330 RepID=A0ABU5TAD8_9MICC|nr:uroporphyrinogen-III C-methyltransferase [Sinomonas sp. JGH33]MEA5456647.1 uroporphyrinogen-III C-methyltransferase [Sinomonas sp. JGH33]